MITRIGPTHFVSPVAPVVRVSRGGRQRSNSGGEGTPATMSEESGHDPKMRLRAGRNVATAVPLNRFGVTVAGMSESELRKHDERLRRRKKRRKKRDGEGDDSQEQEQEQGS